MHGRAHLLIGAGLGVALGGGVSLDHAPVIATTAVSALLPDLDHEHSDASRLYTTVGTGLGSIGLGWLVLRLAAVDPGQLVGQLAREIVRMLLSQDTARFGVLVLIGALALLALVVVDLLLIRLLLELLRPSRYFQHRGALHWPSTGLLLGLVAVLVAWRQLGTIEPGVAFAVGWFSHLLADTPTLAGMPLLEPFARAPEHEHWRRVDVVRLNDGQAVLDDEPVWEAYPCTHVHLTPTWFRWRSGDRAVEVPIAAAVLGFGILGTSAPSWLPVVVAQLLHRA
jgi:membrane-bound metal-dependent hydrolase YbcI (DUF457 family)